MKAKLIWYVLNLLEAIDQLCTAILGGFCDESMSSYSYRMRLQKKPWGFTANVIDWLALHLFGIADHCHKAYLNKRADADLPPELRNPF